MNCARCQVVIPQGEEMNHMGQVLCEDCYVEAIEPPRTCDVTAVYSAKLARKQAGHEGTDGLTDLQKEMYEFVKASGKVIPEALIKKFRLAPWQLEKQVATLRHCELLKGTMIDGVKYLVVMDGGPGTLDI
ncbi:MAG: hypothetical protein ACYDG6_01320 [Thermincolia bacterium]